jgi:hypothetical protein
MCARRSNIVFIFLGWLHTEYYTSETQSLPGLPRALVVERSAYDVGLLPRCKGR